MQVISSDANARALKLAVEKAVVIDLPADIREVLVADPKTVTVVVRTMRRVSSSGRPSVRPTSFSTMTTAGRSSR